MRSCIEISLQEHINLSEAVINTLIPKIENLVKLILSTYKKKGKVILFGNGGSAADSQHIAAELVGYGFPAVALTTDTSVLTSIANDFGYEWIFSNQIDTLMSRDDLAIAISTSGNSKSVIQGLFAVKEVLAKSAALLGNRGGVAKRLTNLPIVVPSSNTARIQEIHITIGHIVCELVENEYK